MPDLTARDVAQHSIGQITFGSLRPPRSLVLGLLVGSGYCVGTELGLLLTPGGSPISTLWPPNALVFASLLLTRTGLWPLLLVCVLPFHMAVQLSHGIPVLTAAGWYLTNVSEALLGAACLRRFAASRQTDAPALFQSFEGILHFVLFGVVTAPVVTSFLDVGVVVGTGWGADYWRMWLDRSFSNMLANLTLVPLIVLVVCRWRFATLSRHRYIEAASIAASITVIVGIVFGTADGNVSVETLIYVLLPVLLWAAVRFGSAGASISLLLIAVLSTWNAIHFRGPFGPHAEQIRSLQIFLTALGVPLLCLSAALEEGRLVHRKLREHEQLASLVSQIATNFVNIEWNRIDQQISDSLARLREFLAADRVSLFQFAGGDLRLAFSAFEGEHNRPPERIPPGQTGWLVDSIYPGKGIFIRDVNDLPPDSEKRRRLTERGVKSIVIVPLGARGSHAGTLSVTSSAVKDWPPNLLPQLAIVADILYSAMQRKKAFEALAESEQRFRQTADHAPMLLWMCGTDGARTYFNRTWLDFTGVSVQDQSGNGWKHLLHPDDIDEYVHSFTNALMKRQEFKLEYRLKHHDGGYRRVLDSGVPRFDGEGGFLGYIGSGMDITERRSQGSVIDVGGKLITVQEEERRRIARELHDDVVQRLALIAIDLDRLRKRTDSSLQESMLHLLNEARSISDCIRDLSHNLHPPSLDLLPLSRTLDALCQDFTDRTSIIVHFDAGEIHPSLAAEIKICLYRITQEALQNVVKHSRAEDAAVRLITDEQGTLKLTISDDGIGFDQKRLAASAGLGLTSMSERVAAVGGTLAITSRPGQGTRIEVSVPFHGERSANAA